MMQRVFLLLVAFVLSLSQVWASGKTLKPGYLYLGYSAGFSETDTFFVGERETSYPYNTYLGHYFMAAMGVVGTLNAYTSVLYAQTREKNNASIDQNTFGDMVVGLKYGLLKQADHFLFAALSVDLKQPVTDYAANLHTSVGDGQRDYSIQFSLTREFQLLVYQFINGSAKYQFREEDPVDRYVLKAEYGFYLFNLLSFSSFIETNRATTGPDLGEPGANIINTRIDYTIWGVKLGVYPVKNFLIEANYSQSLSARNTLIFRNFGAHIGYMVKVF